MFRDRERALQELQEQLLEDEEALPEEEELQEDFQETDFPEEMEEELPEVRAYNSDKADTDLDAFSDDVYATPRSRSGCALWVILLTATVLLVLAYFLAKQGGLL